MSRTIRALGAVMVLAAAASCGFGGSDVTAALPKPRAEPAGSVVIPTGTEAGTVVQRLRETLGAGATIIDHTADASAVGTQIPTNTVVMGSTAAAQLPLLRVDQRAAVNLPQRYLVRQGTDGIVTLTYDGADYIAALSGVTKVDTVSLLRDNSAAVAGRVAPPVTVTAPTAAPLVGVTPSDYLLTVFGSATVPITAERLRKAGDLAGNRTKAVLDMAAGAGDGGTPIRPTMLVFVSVPAAETPLIAAKPAIGVDLPLRFVVWLDDQNRTQIAYPDPRRIAARHGIVATDPNVVKLVTEGDRLAKLGAGITG